MDDTDYVPVPLLYVVELQREDIAELVAAARTLAALPWTTIDSAERMNRSADSLASQVEFL